MAATLGRIPGIPRWVGATADITSERRDGDTLNLTMTPRVPRIRGRLYGAWLALTRKA